MAKDYRSRFADFKTVEAEKDELLQGLLNDLDQARVELDQAKLDLASEQDARRRIQQNLVLAEKRTERRQYVVVLIDADADVYKFHDTFLRQGTAGGEAVAKELLQQAKQYFESVAIDTQEVDVIVKAFANVEGLGQALIRQNKVSSITHFRLFLAGFTSQLAFFDFVDVGAGKELADNKIRENLKFFVESWQCKHVVLGCCHDSGYTSFLTDLVANHGAQDRITLLSMQSISSKLSRLGLKNTRFGTVFAPSFSNGHPEPSIQTHYQKTTESKMAKSIAMPNEQRHRFGPIQRREDGTRTDRPLTIHPSVVQSVSGKNLCHWYYLRGECRGCSRNHTYRALNDEEFDALWYLSRKARCFAFQKKKDCDDPECVYGHAGS